MSRDDDLVAGRARRGVRDGNNRIARIARWIGGSSPSESITTLALEVTASEETEMVAAWPRKDVSEQLAYEINRLIEDAANDRGQTVSALLYWAREDGVRWLSKSFRATPDDDNREVVRPLDGTQLSVIQALQRHNEALAQTNVQLSTRAEEKYLRLMELYDRTLERQSKQIDDLVATVAAIQEERDVARDDAQTAAELANEAAETAEKAVEAAERAKESDTLSTIVETGMKQLMTGIGGGGKN